MVRPALTFVAGVAAVLIGAVAVGLGLVHYSVDNSLWLVTFGMTVLVGLTLFVWGGRTVLAVLPVPRISVSIERNG